MNKIITTSLLLLAGTALSQAATVNLCDGLSSSGSALSGASSSTSDSGVTAAVVQSWLSSATAGTLYEGLRNGNNGSSNSVSAAYNSNESSLYFIHRHNYNGSIVGWCYDLSDADLSSTVSISLSYSNITSTSSTCGGNVAIVYQTSEGWQITQGTEFTATTNGNSVSTSATLSDVTLTSSTIYLVVYSSKDSSSGYATLTGTLVATASYTAVPEPSAFGLLAGLGALVLVASRRRRRVAPAGIVAG